MMPQSETAAERHSRLRRALAFVVRIFFRRLEIVGLDKIPADRGGILVAWHPNGLVDPALILSTFPGSVAFGARHGLFHLPLLGRLLRALGTVPIYRRQDLHAGDVEDQRRRNDASLDALADRLTGGSFSALFPEGMSHDAPFLKEIKTGAARLYYRARARTPAEQPAPVVIPVGLHYDQKRVFRSCALVVFHRPLALPAELDRAPRNDEDDEAVRDLARRLTTHIEAALRAAVLETESWEVHRLLHRIRKLIRAERASRAGCHPGGASMDEKVVGLRRIWVAYQALARKRPAEVRALRRRVERYDGYLRGLGMEDHELDSPPSLRARGAWLALAMQAVVVLGLLPPIAIVGYVMNVPTAAVISAVAGVVGKEEKDTATLKLLGGIVLFPATWAVWAWLVVGGRILPVAGAVAHPAVAVVATVLFAIVGAAVMLRYAGWVSSTLRALRVRFTRGQRARALERLRKERARLCDDLLEMAVGIELPGVVYPDGRVARASAVDLSAR